MQPYPHKLAKTIRSLIAVISIFLLSLNGFSQIPGKSKDGFKYKLAKADELFAASDYENACEIYLEVLSKKTTDTTLLCIIGDCYRLLNDTKNAEDFYRRALTGGEPLLNSDYYFHFGQVLMANSKYEEAQYWNKEYLKLRPDDQRALASMRSIENISELYYDTTLFIVKPVAFNTGNSELCPEFYGDKLFFLSNGSSKNKEFMEWYTIGFDSAGNYNTPVKFNKGFKTLYNEGPAVFYNHFSGMIFTQNYLPNGKPEKRAEDVPLKLFSSQRDTSGNWTSAKLLSFQLPDFSYSQPTVSANGRTLYFSSDMPGGFGGYDIYKSVLTDTSWSQPVNLGKYINTAGDEMFPRMYADSVLYFSSNGQGGLGLLDIFKVNTNNPEKIQNLGAPINSSQDDFGFIMDSSGTNGYLSSNRLNGKFDDNIYAFKRVRTLKNIRIVDKKTQQPVAGVKIFMAGNDSIPVGITDSTGNLTLFLPTENLSQVRIEKDTYEPQTIALNETMDIEQIEAKITSKFDTPDVMVFEDEAALEAEMPKGVVYKVQIFASRKQPQSRELKRKYHGLMKISEMVYDNWFKYSIGEFKTYHEARNCKLTSEVPDAFVAAYINNKLVHIKIAKKITNEDKVPMEISAR